MSLLLSRALLALAALSVAVGLTIKGVDEPEKQYAWVTMGFNMEGARLPPAKQTALLYEVFALASSIRKNSQYPLVLITDLSTFENPDDLRSALEQMGVIIYDMQRLVMPEKFVRENQPTWAGAWNKLQMFNMTQWHRLVWVDTDGMLSRSMDYLFEKPGTWSQGDDYFCQGYPNGVCSGVVAFTPDHEMFDDIMAYAETLDSLEGGDQELIESYFAHIGEPVQLLPAQQAAFGQCVQDDKDMPDFVHKPKYYQACLRALSLLKRKQEYSAHALDECISYTGSTLWRDNLCDSEMSRDDVGFSLFCDFYKAA